MGDAARLRALEIWQLKPGQAKTPIWLDCDPGHDDAFSILLAAHCPSIELLGVSSVHGNSSLTNTTWNARSVLEAIGKRDVPVYPGAEKPFARWPCYAPKYHGKTGLDGTDLLPEPVRPPASDVPAITAMYNALAATPKGTVWLVTNGALTNAALLFAVHPELAEHLAGVSIMGGGVGNFFTHAPMGRFADRVRLSPQVWHTYPAGPPEHLSPAELARLFLEQGLVLLDDDDGRALPVGELAARLDRQRRACGNWSPAAEFNIYCDPEAVQAVVAEPRLARKTTLIPLDVTHQVLADAKVLELLSNGYGGSTTTAATDVEGDDVGPSPPPPPAPSGRRGRSKLRQMFHELLVFFSRTYHEQFGMDEGPPLHDPIAVVAALAPALYDDRGGERFDVYVCCEGEPNGFSRRREFADSGELGRTVVKPVDKAGGEGVRIPRTLNIDVFWMLVELALEAAEKVSPLDTNG